MNENIRDYIDIIDTIEENKNILGFVPLNNNRQNSDISEDEINEAKITLQKSGGFNAFYDRQTNK